MIYLIRPASPSPACAVTGSVRSVVRTTYGPLALAKALIKLRAHGVEGEIARLRRGPLDLIERRRLRRGRSVRRGVSGGEQAAQQLCELIEVFWAVAVVGGGAWPCAWPHVRSKVGRVQRERACPEQ